MIENPRRIDRPCRSLVVRMALRRSRDVERVGMGILEIGSVVICLLLMLGCCAAGFVEPDKGE